MRSVCVRTVLQSREFTSARVRIRIMLLLSSTNCQPQASNQRHHREERNYHELVVGRSIRRFVGLGLLRQLDHKSNTVLRCIQAGNNDFFVNSFVSKMAVVVHSRTNAIKSDVNRSTTQGNPVKTHASFT